MNQTGYAVLKIPKTGAAFAYAKEAREFATGATGAGGYLHATATAEQWSDVRFVSAIGAGSSILPVSMGASVSNIFTGVATVIGGTTPIGDLRSEDGPYVEVAVGSSSVYYTKKNQEYQGAFYAAYIGGTNSSPRKIGIGTTTSDISTSGYYEGSFTTNNIHEFQTAFTADSTDLSKITTGSGVYTEGGDVTLQFNILNRNGEQLSSAAQIAADPFVSGQKISILNTDGSVAFSDYRIGGDSTFTFSSSQNIDVFGSFTRNFGIRNQVVNQDGGVHTSEFYLYANTATFNKVFVSSSGQTVLNETYSNHNPPNTGSITSAADRTDAIKYFNNQPINDSGVTGFIEFDLGFNESPNFTSLGDVVLFHGTGEDFITNRGSLVGNFPLNSVQEGQRIRLTANDGIPEGTGLFFKLAADTEVGFNEELFTVGPFTLEPTVEGPDLNLYNQGDQSLVGDFTIEGGLEGDDANGGNLNVSGNALGTGIGGRLTGPDSKMYLLSGDEAGGGGTDTLQTVTARGNTTVGLDVNFQDGTLFVDHTNQRIGIGTTNPTQKLDVDGIITSKGLQTNTTNTNYSLISRNSAGNSPLYVQSANSNTDQPIAFFSYGSATANAGTKILKVGKDKSYFDNTNVGIGITNPTVALDVAGAGKFTSQVTIPATPSASTDAASKGYVDSQVGSADTLQEVTTNGNTTTNNVSIGKSSSPTVALDVEGAGKFTSQVTIPATPSASTDAASKGYVDAQVGSADTLQEVTANGNTTDQGIEVTAGGIKVNDYLTHYGDTDTYLGFPSNNNFELYTAGGSALAIDPSQNIYFHENVGIGSNGSSPQKLFVAGNSVEVKIATSDGYSIKSEQKAIIAGIGASIFSTGSAILGGSGHHISGDYDTIAGGTLNNISGGNFNFIGGGSQVDITGSQYSSSVGGKDNDILNSNHSAIGGGVSNKIENASSSVIAGGETNEIHDPVSAIVGGNSHIISGGNGYSFIGGGEENEVHGTFSSVLGGEGNKVYGSDSVTLGGWFTESSGRFALVGPGKASKVSGDYAVGLGNQVAIPVAHSGATVLADGQDRVHASSGAHTATLDFSGGVYVPTSGMFGEGLFVSGVPVLTGEINPPEVDTLQTVTTRGNETTTSIISTGPYISGVTGLFSDKVGIGTTSPNAKLEVLGKQMITTGANASPQTEDYLYIGGDGLAGANAAIYIGNRGNGSGYGWRMLYEGVGSGNDNKLKFKSENLGSPVDVITMLQDGKVGIGTTSPNNKLDVVGSASIDVLQHQSESTNYWALGTSASYQQRVTSRTATAITQVIEGHSSQSADLLQIRSSSASNGDYVTVNSDGDVGIGSTSPSRLLTLENNSSTVSNNSQLRINNIGAGDAYIYLFAGSDWSLGIDNSDSDKFKLCTTNDVSDGTEVVTVDRSGNVGIGTTSPSNALDVVGHFSATSKSFLIDHPTKENKKLQYASLEGPENGVYVRGTTDKETIELPEYWSELVHEDSITVVLTPIGKKQDLFIKEKSNKLIKIGGAEGSFDYVVYGERKDIDKLEIEPSKV